MAAETISAQDHGTAVRAQLDDVLAGVGMRRRENVATTWSHAAIRTNVA